MTMNNSDNGKQNGAVAQLRGAGRTYGKTVALHPLDLTFPPGQTTALIGPSGCGKSTILRMIVGLVAPSEGQAFVDGEAVTPRSAPALRKRMGYVIQDGGLFPHLSAEDNVALAAREAKQPAGEIQARLRELADLTRFPIEGLTRYPAQLSGGQKQRVSLMRALMLRPDLLLLDEPLGALDPLVRARLQSDLKDIFAREGRTVILVTHDMSEAAYLADYLILMEAGRVVQQGTLADLQHRPAAPFVGEFLNAQRSLVAL